MEPLIGVLVLIAIIALVYWLNRPSDDTHEQVKRQSPAAGSQVTTTPRAPATTTSGSRSTSTTLEAFDPGTAHRVERPRIIEGPARIIDGDTIVIKKTQIRLFGIDAPELEHPYGQKAKWAMARLCKGHRIRAEIVEEDGYGRTVAKCFLPDGQDLSAELVQQGLAIDWPKFSGGKYSRLETPGVRKKLWLADARQKGRMHVWAKFEARKRGDGQPH
jgi:endonuclease YncB( thermonuclease family)